MKGMRLFLIVGCLCVLGMPVNAQPADSSEDAGIVPVTGDLSPWRNFGVDVGNFDNVWIIALNNGDVAAFKRGSELDQPGVVGGSEFLIFGADGSLKTETPVRGNFNSQGDPYPFVDFGATGLLWGSFTHGAHADRANGNGFVVHNQGENAATFGLEQGDVVGDEAFSMVQFFSTNGEPVGSTINAFGSLTAAPGDYRDIGALFLSNGNAVAIGENRQGSDELLDAVGANAGEVMIATILAPDGSTLVEPFVPHTDDNGQSLGGSSSAVFQNGTAFGGGFVLDYNSGMRWYNNDGTPRTSSQPDHEELADTVISTEVLSFTIGANSGGRGDSMAIASNGEDLVVKSFPLSSGDETIGVLVYYNTDGTVRNWVRFDDVNLLDEPAKLDRTFCDMDTNGNVFVVWEDKRFGGDSDDGLTQVFGRFFDSEGEPFGPSFPVFEHWRREPSFVDFGEGVGEIPRGDQQQPRCAMNDQVAAVISASTLMPEIPDTIKQLSAAFGLVLNEAVIRIFENPFQSETQIDRWSLY